MHKVQCVYLRLAAAGAGILLAGCSAPLGPLGGTHLNGLLLSHCHCSARGTCDQDDPLIVPPYSSFHPLPTRPVFSPPTSIPGLYAPWPGSNPAPLPAGPPAGTDVRLVPTNALPNRLTSAVVPAAGNDAADERIQPLILRR
jgi:hypothetical protein